jgi:hypothetical protein
MVNVANVLLNKGELGEAERTLRKVLETFDRLNDVYGKALALENLGTLCFEGLRWAEAVRTFDESRACFERVGDHASAMVVRRKGQEAGRPLAQL